MKIPGIKSLIKFLFFRTPPYRILFGPSKGMYVNYGMSGRLQHLTGLYEKEIHAFIKRGILRSDYLINVGANDGYYVLAFLKSGKPCLACEPGVAAKDIAINAALNGYYPCDGFQLEKRLIGNDAGFDYVGVAELTKNIHQAKFFLVDIDGGEIELLKSCGEEFNHGNCFWLIETHSKILEDQCISYLLGRKYKVKIIKNAWWRCLIPENRPLDHNRWLYAEPV